MTACPIVKIKASHPSQGDFVEINECDFDPAKHERFVEPLPAPPAPVLPPPPPAPADPLASLLKEWREQDYGTLRGIALAVTKRVPENRKQAVQMIEQELAKRAK
jgi:hypothetical protein